jgi:hypothetical protein
MPYYQNKWYNSIIYPFGKIFHKCHLFIVSFKIFLTIFGTLSNTENALGILREKIWKYESVGVLNKSSLSKHWLLKIQHIAYVASTQKEESLIERFTRCYM